MARASSELLHDISAAAGISEGQADKAVTVILQALAARLPSPVFGRVQSVLADGDDHSNRPGAGR